MNYTYEIIINNEDEVFIVEKNLNKNIEERWFLETIVNYSDDWENDKSFLRVKKWISKNHMEMLL